MVRIASNPHGPRLYVLGCRVHHGVSGSVVAAGFLALRHRRLAIAAAVYAATDWRDFPFTDKCNH